jgi:hypothetical protein
MLLLHYKLHTSGCVGPQRYCLLVSAVDDPAVCCCSSLTCLQASYENTGNDQTYSTYYSSTGGSMQVGGSADGTVDKLAMQLAAGQQLPNETTQLATAGKQQTSNGKQQQQQQQKKKIEAGKKQSSAGQPGKPAAAKHEHLTALLLASMTDK